MTRLYVAMSDDEWLRLSQRAHAECRAPRDQARYLLRLALLGAGDSPPDAGSTNDKSAFTSQGAGALVETTIQSHP